MYNCTKLSTLAALLLGAVLAVYTTSATVATEHEDGVFFLGVDTLPVQHQLSSSGEYDRWAFSDFARQAFEGAAVANLTHSLAHWRPLEDPFNVGIVVLTDLTTSSVGFRGIGYKYFVTAKLVWLHIGQDRQSIGMAKPFPEVRAVITNEHTAEGQSTRPLDESSLAQLKLAAIREGIAKTAEYVAAHQSRSAVRNALDIRYVTVTPAPFNERARNDLARTLDITGDRETREFGERVAQIFESMVMQEVSKSDDLENVVVLPGQNTLDSLTDLWPQYARRVFALSSHSGARRALGDEPPRIRVVSDDACGTGHDPRLIAVPGWHLRTTLASLEVESRRNTDYVHEDHVRLVVAAGVRSPLGKKARSGTKRRTATGTGQTAGDRPLHRPSEVAMSEWLNDDVLSNLLRQGIRAALPEVIKQLRLLDHAASDLDWEGEICDEQA
jgi:hypothetical protein